MTKARRSAGLRRIARQMPWRGHAPIAGLDRALAAPGVRLQAQPASVANAALSVALGRIAVASLARSGW